MKINQFRTLPEGTLKEALREMCRCFHEDEESWQWGHVEGRSLKTLGKTKLAELLQEISEELTDPPRPEEMVLIPKAQLGKLTSALIEANTLLDEVATQEPSSATLNPWRKDLAHRVLGEYFAPVPEEPPVMSVFPEGPVLDIR